MRLQHNTPGIEATTGPLGAGIGNAVGMAAAAKLAAAKYNTPAHQIFNHHIIALCGDGCLQVDTSEPYCVRRSTKKVSPHVFSRPARTPVFRGFRRVWRSRRRRTPATMAWTT